MALGKYSRIDDKKSSPSHCSKATVVVVITLCIIGVWMMTSSSSEGVSSQERYNESKTQASEGNGNSLTNEEKTKPFEDNPSNLLVDEANKDAPFQQENVTNVQDATTARENPGEIVEKPEGESKGLPDNVEEKNENEALKQGDKESEEAREKIEGESKGVPENMEKVEGESKGVLDNVEKSEGGSNGVPDNVEKTEGVTNSVPHNLEDKTESEASKGGYKDSGESGEKSENKFVENGAELKPEEAYTHNTKGGDDKGNGITEEKVADKEDHESSPNQSPLPSDVPNIKEAPIREPLNEDPMEKKDYVTNVLPSADQSEHLNETKTQNGAFSTQAVESKNEKLAESSFDLAKEKEYTWKLCNVTAGPDFIPCLDNIEAIKNLKSTMHYEHRERHCPNNPPSCLIPLPEGYQRPIKWPTSREKIWYHNVPHTKLAAYKGHQNWVKANGEYLTFPGGGTQFVHGALHYIDFIQQSVPDITWGKRARVVLDVGCGVASFGGYLFDRDVLTMSLAPKDEHEAQVQFALERGIPAISAVMGTKRLPFPGRVFDVVHCARCRVPWHIEGGKLLLELNRLLRPGGFFVWSATPVYRKVPEDVAIWEAMTNLTKSMCWDLVSITKDKVDNIGIAMYRKPTSNECYEHRSQAEPPLCQESDDPDASWNVPLQACMHKVPMGPLERGSKWPEVWPGRLVKSPYWLQNSQVGVYGKPASEDFVVDYQHWKRVVTKTYLNGMGIDWSSVRNVMDMRAIYGGFAAALKELNVWVMNIISVDAPDTLPIIYERGLFGIYHDWCESFSTYPRSYDLLHADHLFSKIKTKCGLPALVAEVDRILRPDGKLIVRDSLIVIGELQTMLKSMHYEIRMLYSRDKEGLLCVKKTIWRPDEVETLTYAID
ncbi:unnamed protein product [Cuscuta epithymum]|uniref:Methyltransferase PMT24 n=1 Tax=Cuscuta epithymum TaxID=186058 RepID=A0AAV0C851_9ASTE|nr:unnamed protein product [Cuscuta epithymum]